MPVRDTESRLPTGWQPVDLGQAIVSADGRCALVSFLSEPLVEGHDNTYVLFVTDPALAQAVSKYRWTFTENNTVHPTRATDAGVMEFLPSWGSGLLDLKVSLHDAADDELASLHLTQSVVEPCADLEAGIERAADQPGASLSNPEALREVVNRYSTYYQALERQTDEESAALRRFTFMMVLEGASRRTIDERYAHLQTLAVALNDGTEDFAQWGGAGAGVCQLRPVMLAMAGLAGSAPLLPWTELPEREDQRSLAQDKLCKQLGTLTQADQVDLFNVLRFPKSNISHCARIVEGLRDRYFAGTDFDQALAGMSGTRAFWIMRHCLEGPLMRA